MKISKLLKLLSFALMLCMTTQLQAADVDLATAQNAAKAFMSKQVANGRLRAAAATNLQLVKAEASVAKPTAVDYYIFNSDKSYVVVAGDDKAPQILMYGEQGCIDLNNIPPAMQWLLNKYKYQIDGIKAGTLEPVKATTRATVAVAPLVNANWDQSSPYNNQCPTSGSRRAVTGCPATSLSMCYYKWKWPETFPAVAAINGSTTGGYSASALSAREADWDNIIDEYTGPTNYSSTSAQKDAVAWLMRYAGQAIPDYYYSNSASGADDPEIYQGVLNMGYTDAQYLLLTELKQSGSSYTNGPQQYTDAQWNEYMMNELQNGRPIEYLAYDVSGSSVSGHAFNVFGCDSNGKYYVNWGWSGDSNGYCTLHNFTTATGATGQSGSYVFKYGEAMIIGIEPPAGALNNPRIKAEPSTLDMTAIVGSTKTATFTVTGYNLTNAVSLSISGDNAFSLSTNSINVNQAQNGVTVTVTYHPTELGTDDATVTLSSSGADNVTVKLNGTATLQKEDIVLQEAANVDNTSFKAIWTDATPAANVSSYTLWVGQEDPDAIQLLGTINGSNYTGSYTNITLTSPWGGTSVKGGNNAVYFSATGNITFTIPEGYNNRTFTMRIKTVTGNYGSGNITVKSAQTAAVGHTFSAGETFNWLVQGSTGEKITITTTDNSYSPDMALIEVYAGDATQAKAPTRGVSEEGDATYRIITGITDKSYTVNNLTPEATYYFRVKAIYVDGTESNWTDTKQVTLLDDTNPSITATPTSMDFGACYTGQSAQQTLTITGKNLTGNITAALTDPNGVFTLSATSVTPTQATQGKAITVTFNPKAVQNYTGSIKLTSAGATDVTVNLTGAGQLLKAVPVMEEADTNYVKHTSFRADWTDETPEANVASYTLWVNQYEEPTSALLLKETFAKFTTANTSTDIGSSLDTYMDNAGWTGSIVFQQVGAIRVGSRQYAGYLTSPTLDLSQSGGKITIKVKAKYYTNYSSDNSQLVVTCGDATTNVALTADEAEYTIVLDVNAAAAGQNVKFSNTAKQKRFDISGIEIYSGDATTGNATLMTAVETGDATTRTITGITDRFYNVLDLTGGGTFNYKVKAIYTDNTESDWSNVQQVTLKEVDDTGLKGDVNQDGKVDVSDVNLAVNIILGKESRADYISRADMDGNGNVDVSDVNLIVNIILGK